MAAMITLPGRETKSISPFDFQLENILSEPPMSSLEQALSLSRTRPLSSFSSHLSFLSVKSSAIFVEVEKGKETEERNRFSSISLSARLDPPNQTHQNPR
ncbi:acyl-coenzyme A synthetase ACSM4, mitochondrial-like protein [Corchorus capsularis]|uniref:Acyl-coenzyme A synthetase ACSM4, mitochondrial-like protein n=1 Tax=Corchorus capsularis TaxID=210143 RepID=A0A1R3HM88_COCAP|nr:acyl-coenzyme A synthetase ACSM4, mitochondrial-like protein [Corchorus capsularis]